MSEQLDVLTSAIHDTTFTVTALTRRVATVDQVVDSIMFQSEVTDVVTMYTTRVNEAVSSREAAIILGWGTDWLTDLSPDGWRTLSAALRTWADTVATVTLYVPVTLDEAHADSLGQHGRAVFGETFLQTLPSIQTSRVRVR